MTSPSPDRIRLAEALLFQSSGPVSRTMLARALGEDVEIAQILTEVGRRTVGLGFELVAVGEGWMFRTSPDLAEALRAVLERPPERLPRAALEVLLQNGSIVIPSSVLHASARMLIQGSLRIYEELWTLHDESSR